MSDLITKEGYDFAFDPKACETCAGNCCIGESGNIWVSVQKIPEMAAFLKISPDEFIGRYLKKVGYRFSLREKVVVEGEYDCIFYDREKRRCEIYPVRPLQCRTYPFWDYFKENEEELREECPGICPKLR
ncbi:YkgJ family cysteine cluster protein [Hydrogenimonas sp.]